MHTETPPECVISCLPQLFPGAACSDHGHLFAPVRHDPVSRDAGCLEKSASPHAVLADFHAGPLSRAQNLGRTRSLDPGLDHRMALPLPGESNVLECPSARGVVGAGSPAHLATTERRCPLSCG